jgi:RNA polymerase sigma factor (sigma-70 family)
MPAIKPSPRLTDYLNRIGRYPLLTPSQEIELARVIQRGLAPNATPREQRQGKRARDKMVCTNLRLVVSLAREYTTRCSSYTLEDLIQSGNLGLAHATCKFDPERGYKFSTYSRRWIKSFIGRAIIGEDAMVRLPEQRYWQMLKVMTYNRKPGVTLAQACEEADLKEADRAPVLQAGMRHVSLNARCNDGDERSDQIQDTITKEYDEDEQERIAVVREALMKLPQEQLQAVKLRYGIGGTLATEKEMARELGTSLYYTRCAWRKGQQILASDPTLKELCGLSCDKTTAESGNAKGLECAQSTSNSGKH